MKAPQTKLVIKMPSRFRLSLMWVRSWFWTRRQREAWAEEVAESDKFIADVAAADAERERLGSVNGRHFTEYVETVKQLKREGRYGDAEALLLQLQAAAVAEAQFDQRDPPPWYADQLRIVGKMKAGVGAKP